MKIVIPDSIHGQPSRVELARSLLRKARKIVTFKIARACVSDRRRIIELIELHIELFELERSLHRANIDLIEEIIEAWSD